MAGIQRFCLGGAIIKARYAVFGIIAALCLLTTILALSCAVVCPWFGCLPLFLWYAAILSGCRLAAKGWRAGCAAAALCVFVTFAAGIAWIGNPRQQHKESKSPGGTHTLVIETDLMDRPTVYERTFWIFMRPVISATGTNARMETFAPYIRWLDEERFVLFFNGDTAWILDMAEDTLLKGTYYTAPEGYPVIEADGKPILYLEGP